MSHGNSNGNDDTRQLLVNGVADAVGFVGGALLGFWLMLSLRVYTRRILSHISWPLFFGLLAGVLDEGIQMFADGRGSDVRDVVIDFSGVVFGLLAALFLLLLVRMFHVLRESKTPL